MNRAPSICLDNLLGTVTFTLLVILPFAVQQYSPISDVFMVIESRPSNSTGPDHLYIVDGILWPLEMAEHVRTILLLDIEEEMLISITFEIVPVFIKETFQSLLMHVYGMYSKWPLSNNTEVCGYTL